MRIRDLYIVGLVSCLLSFLCSKPVIAQETSLPICKLVLPENIPDGIEATFKTARDHLTAEQFDQAIQQYGSVLIRLDDLNTREQHTLFKSQVVLALAYALYQSGGADRAVPLLEDTIESLTTFGQMPLELGIAAQNLGQIQEDLGNFTKAAQNYSQAASIFESLGCSQYQLFALTSTAIVQTWLGQYVEANETLYSNLKIGQRIGDNEAIGDIYHTLGWVAFLQKRYSSALDFYQTALDHGQQFSSNVVSLSRTLNNIGHLYTQVGDFDAAVKNLEQGLELISATPAGIAERIDLLDSLGQAYAIPDDHANAWLRYHQALRLAHRSEHRYRRLISLLNIAKTLASADQTTVAIAFYKQAINDIEQVRTNLRSLPLETQQRYTQTVADSYRALAALLLAQERVFEAQQVLDLLKIQELEDYLHDVRGERPPKNGKLPYLPPERLLLDQHQTLLLEGQLLEGQSETAPVLSLEEFLTDPDVAAALDALEQSNDTTLQPESLQQLQQKLQTLPHKSAVLYPLVLEDRIELLLVPPEGPPIHQTTVVNKHQLTEQVSHLRHRLADPSSDVKTSASVLYKAIVEPLQESLNRANIQNIIYIPDSVLHYIPLSVLYDPTKGQWLAEQYTSHNLTASDIGDLTQPSSRPFNVLAGAFTDTNQTFEKLIDQKTTNFHGLTYAGHEVSFLQQKLPSTQILLNADFSRNNLETQFQGQNIIHLATHAAFIPGQPEDSFILLGDGDIITLKELRNLALPNVDLVVLSACQTGISHIEDGLEILGMGFQVQRTDARAALASLWWVDDRATSQLMELFYTELAAGASKAQALQYAQRQLIANGQDEPYYWAPFVLIGNGL